MKPAQPDLQNNRPNTPLRSRTALGWTISIIIHIVAAGVFLTLSLIDTSPADPARETPTSALQQPPEPLELEPVVTDLQLDTPHDPQLLPDQAEIPLIPDPAWTAGDDADAITVYNNTPHDSSSPGLTQNQNYQSQFCGNRGSGARICFVVDHSGSMVMAHDYVRRQPKKTISQLGPHQYFNIIFYAGGQPRTWAPDQLRRANAPNRYEALCFIDSIRLTQVGSTDQAWQAVINALQAAFAARTPRELPPQLIYLLTDGEFDHQHVLNGIRSLQDQHPRPVNVSVIACGSRDSEDFLKKLAAAYHGQYRFVTDEELAQP